MSSTVKPPAQIRLEASSLCNLRCPLCPTTTGQIHHRSPIGGGLLKFEDFRKMLDDNPQLKLIELSNWGEIFLNPAILSMMELAHQRGVELVANNGVNLNKMRPEVLDGVVKYQFRGMVCSIDGASQETYSIYRVRGNFDTVIANIRAINELKRRYNSSYPKLTWKFVVFGHNEHEIPKAREMARELGMDFVTRINWDPTYSPLRDADAIRAETKEPITWDEYDEANDGEYCHQLWDSPQINWDGKVLGCCINIWGDFGGNAFRDGLTASLNTDQIKHARKMLTGKAEPRDDVPCTQCDLYQKMRKRGVTVKRAPAGLQSLSQRFIPAAARPMLRNLYWGVSRHAKRLLPNRSAH